MRKYEARAEFRRLHGSAPWVLAGAWIGNQFYPAQPGVDPVRRRLPAPGLVAWVDLPAVIAASRAEAAERALQVAREGWPKAAKPTVPHP